MVRGFFWRLADYGDVETSSDLRSAKVYFSVYGDEEEIETARQHLQRASGFLHHNLKEERVLYPRADVVLPPTAAERLRAFLGSGELPEGWVCVKARPATQNADG